MSLDSIRPGGAGFASSIRVRLLHAAVRQRILKMAAERPSYFNVEKWGVPINDLDSVATIGTFSATLIWLSLPRQGLILRKQEEEDLIALWRYIAHLVGTPTDAFETPTKAKAFMESLLLYEVDPSETSKILANNIIASMEGQPPTWASREYLVAQTRWLNGNALCDRLGLMKVGWWYWALMAGQCFFFIGMCYPYRAIKSWDKAKVATLRRIFYAMIVTAPSGLGKETNFEFQYIPDFSTLTEMGEKQEVGIKAEGIERRNFKALLIGVGVLGLFSVITTRIASSVLTRVF
jgi:ER-bound oxygenase mpaB/B'/Rubber oxygenase, catalytic domain